MKLSSIKSHLRPYSILGKRKTTISHAFASAISPTSPWNEDDCIEVMKALGQSNMDFLHCTYCSDEAQTWDHLGGLVKNKKFSGYGHTLGNLVPSCRNCNSRKGNKAWRAWMESMGSPPELIERVAFVAKRYGAYSRSQEEMEAKFPQDFADLARVKEKIFDSMAEADLIADRIRGKN
jgi:hypothetical protein